MKNRFLRFLQLRRYRITLVLIDVFCIWLIISAASFFAGVDKPSLTYHLTTIFVWLMFATFFLLYSIWRYRVKKIFYAIFSSWIFLNVLTFYFGKLGDVSLVYKPLANSYL